MLGGLTCLGSVAALFSRSVGQALWGERVAGEALVTLVETRVLGEQLLNNLRAWRSAGLDLKYGKELIGQANELARRLLEVGVTSGAYDGEEERLR
ncbi:hypothetical protein D7V97_18220 [Corallococcus sp. CA053C]|uniref:hypothetical protein n=1 Tax=Corallococcus sp. CA053C TaxID=2316732 RepID=UPI000EA0F0B1|nr:hypothetical protein [Corallococcus sp. CA053C]RKH08860.1 hypothetical protein D7V97_18220 [Corallococcus sp. CA053C]